MTQFFCVLSEDVLCQPKQKTLIEMRGAQSSLFFLKLAKVYSFSINNVEIPD